MTLLSFPCGRLWGISRDAPPLPPSLYGRSLARSLARSYADVITKSSRLDGLPIFLTHGASLARFARWSSPNKSTSTTYLKINWARLTEVLALKQLRAAGWLWLKSMSRTDEKWKLSFGVQFPRRSNNTQFPFRYQIVQICSGIFVWTCVVTLRKRTIYLVILRIEKKIGRKPEYRFRCMSYYYILQVFCAWTKNTQNNLKHWVASADGGANGSPIRSWNFWGMLSPF